MDREEKWINMGTEDKIHPEQRGGDRFLPTVEHPAGGKRGEEGRRITPRGKGVQQIPGGPEEQQR